MPSDQYQKFLEGQISQRRDGPHDIMTLRAGFEMLAQILQPPDGTTITAVDVDGIPGEWVDAPDADTDRAILFLHSGGYCIGCASAYRNFNARMSAAADARVLAIDYSLAPEHPFPAAVDDALTAYRWLLAQGCAPERLAICGDSGGGGLTVAALVALRDAGVPLPACAVPISPWVDMELCGDVSDDAKSVDLLSLEHLTVFASAYLGETDPRTPLADPLFADLSGLPPLLVMAGSREILLDDAKRLGVRAAGAGVDVDLHIAPGMIHLWHMFGGWYPEAEEASDLAGGYIRKRLA